jgi:hypothetical protein
VLAGRPDAAQGHAQVLGLDDHTDTARGQVLLQPVGHLLGQPLLDLQVAGEQLEHPGELREAEDPLAGQVADVRHPGEGQQVVLAQGLQRDVPGDDQLVVALVVGEGRQVELRGGHQLGVGGDHPLRRLGQVRRCRVLAQRPEQRGDRLLGGGQVHRPALPDDPEGRGTPHDAGHRGGPGRRLGRGHDRSPAPRAGA